MSKIVIISSGSPCRNPRPVKEADTLGRAGHKVTLLTVSESRKQDRLENALAAGESYRHESVGRNSHVLLSLARRVRLRLASRLTAAGYPTLYALGHPSALRRRAFELKPDLTIVHNEVPFWIGCDLLRAGLRVAADFEDWHSEDLLPDARRSRPMAHLRKLERQLLHQAVFTSTTSEALSRALANRYGSPRPNVITNSFPLQSNPKSEAPGSPPSFFWFSQTLGPGRGIEEFCAAWVKTKCLSHLVLLGEPCPGFQEQLLAKMPRPFASRTTIRPLVSSSELPTVIAQHDIGLALEQSWILNRDLTITNKILQYLNAGLAIVATPTAGQREVLSYATGAGHLLDFRSSDQAALILDGFIADRSRLGAAQRRSRLAAETKFCWELEAPRFINLVEAATARQSA